MALYILPTRSKGGGDELTGSAQARNRPDNTPKREHFQISINTYSAESIAYG
jgi:hypothetical protein